MGFEGLQIAWEESFGEGEREVTGREAKRRERDRAAYTYPVPIALAKESGIYLSSLSCPAKEEGMARLSHLPNKLLTQGWANRSGDGTRLLGAEVK